MQEEGSNEVIASDRLYVSLCLSVIYDRCVVDTSATISNSAANDRLSVTMVYPPPGRLIYQGNSPTRGLVKTQFILRWIENPDDRRRIHRQLNKGEALHALRRFLFFAHEGKVQRRQADQQTNQVLCLNLVTNAIVTWNTVYMNAAIERLRAEGRIGRDIDLRVPLWDG